MSDLCRCALGCWLPVWWWCALLLFPARHHSLANQGMACLAAR